MDRSPRRLQGRSFDLIVIGGGVYGASVVLEAALRGLRPLLLERADFGSGTSANSLRILHGGLRYLQALDLRRFRQSVVERRRWIQRFPELVRPLPCVMPLYGRGLHRKLVLGPALTLNDLLSADRNRGIPERRRLSGGRILSRAETRTKFPMVVEDGLTGGALWHDVWMVSPHRLIMEMLRWACALGAEALNYAEVTEVLTRGGTVVGVRASDKVGGTELEFRARGVVNAAGPWCRTFARAPEEDIPELFHPSLAFNLLLDHPPPSDAAVAVRAPEPDAPVYFLCPHGRFTLAGTVHAPWPRGDPPPIEVPGELVLSFLAALSRAVPGFSVSMDGVVRILAGLLPAEDSGTARLAPRPRIVAHGRRTGAQGLVTVSGVKFTTAPGVARTVVDLISGSKGRKTNKLGDRSRPKARPWRSPEDLRRAASVDEDGVRRFIQDLIRDEAVVTMEDLVLRRLDWGLEFLDPQEGPAMIRELLGVRSDSFLPAT
jgi:glycerol-3-phosphate dehydrogenase